MLVRVLGWLALLARSDASKDIGDHQRTPATAGLERAQDRGPERAVLAVPDIHPEAFAGARRRAPPIETATA